MSATLAPRPSIEINPRARLIANASLVPFVVLTGLIWLIGYSNLEVLAFVTLGLSCWAALVITFLGGVHWGLAMRQDVSSPAQYLSGAAMLLPAWIGVAMHAGVVMYPDAVVRPDAGLIVLGVSLVAGYLLDRRAYPVLGASAWLNLRFRHSAISAFCCFLAAAGS